MFHDHMHRAPQPSPQGIPARDDAVEEPPHRVELPANPTRPIAMAARSGVDMAGRRPPHPSADRVVALPLGALRAALRSRRNRAAGCPGPAPAARVFGAGSAISSEHASASGSGKTSSGSGSSSHASSSTGPESSSEVSASSTSGGGEGGHGAGGMGGAGGVGGTGGTGGMGGTGGVGGTGGAGGKGGATSSSSASSSSGIVACPGGSAHEVRPAADLPVGGAVHRHLGLGPGGVPQRRDPGVAGQTLVYGNTQCGMCACVQPNGQCTEPTLSILTGTSCTGSQTCAEGVVKRHRRS